MVIHEITKLNYFNHHYWLYISTYKKYAVRLVLDDKVGIII